MKRKFLMYALTAPILGLSVIGATQSASAHGLVGMGQNLSPDEIATRQQNMFQEQAQIFGLTVDEVKNAWAEGKSLKDVAKEKGISQADIAKRMQDAEEARLKTQLQTLVDKGVITQAQADKRLENLKNMTAKGKKGITKKMHMLRF
jgi:hypothetical protein